MIVVDTNVIAYLWIPGSHTSQAEGVLKKDPEWMAPLLWRSEFRNVLAGYLIRGQTDLDIAIQVMTEAQFHLKGREYTVASDHVLSLVRKSKCSAYDCEFVALAEDLETTLVTTDKQILKAFPSIAVSIDQW